jgi:hypothetical protein
VSENKEHSALGQAAGLTTFTPAEARSRFPGCHVDCLCGAPLAVVAYIVANGVRHYKLRCHACQRLSRTSLPQRLLDYAIMVQAPAVRSANASEPGFFCEHVHSAGTRTAGRARRRRAARRGFAAFVVSGPAGPASGGRRARGAIGAGRSRRTVGRRRAGGTAGGAGPGGRARLSRPAAGTAISARVRRRCAGRELGGRSRVRRPAGAARLRLAVAASAALPASGLGGVGRVRVRSSGRRRRASGPARRAGLSVRQAGRTGYVDES